MASSKTDRRRRRNRPSGPPTTSPQKPADGSNESSQISARPPSAEGRSGSLLGVWVAAALTLMGVIAWRSLRHGEGHDTPSVIDAEVPSPAPADVGPAWPGDIDGSYVEVRLPSNYVSPIECVRSQEPWVFRGRSLEQTTLIAHAAGVDAAQLARFGALSQCDVSGCVLTPDAALIESMSRGVRSALYRELARARENRLHSMATMRPREVGPWSAMQGVSPRIRSLIDRATWEIDGSYAFSDLPWICSQLTSDAERAEAVTTLYARYTLDARLTVPPDGDIEPMVRWWSVGNVSSEVRATLERARAERRTVPVVSLLPPMARERVGRLPQPTDPEWDCYWSSTRFFGGATPNDDVPDVSRADWYLQSAYTELHNERDRRLGDLYVFRGSSGNLVHMANLVAGDVLFTKNGRSRTRPWALMRLRDVMNVFPFTTLSVYRRR